MKSLLMLSAAVIMFGTASAQDHDPNEMDHDLEARVNALEKITASHEARLDALDGGPVDPPPQGDPALCTPSAEEGHFHTDDPSKALEHSSMLALVPRSEATSIAWLSGDWNNPATWCDGKIPSDGAKVLIPAGISVGYGIVSQADIKTIRNDGTFWFHPDHDSHLLVDTMISTPGSTLQIGTDDKPIMADKLIEIVLADNGPIDVTWDPFLLSRSVIMHGATTITGAAKTPYLRTAGDPKKGDTKITLQDEPQGWRIGDRLVLSGTHLMDSKGLCNGCIYETSFQDEELTVTAIDGKTVSFAEPLQFDHDGRGEYKAVLADLTRNIRIRTENPEVPVQQRGHTIAMHSDDVSIFYAEFADLGRTDKSVRAHDIELVDQPTSELNAKSRYPLHIHRTALSDPTNPAVLYGNSVHGSPGWGIVHHDANAHLQANVVYDAFSACYVAETANEIGRWVDNLCIKVTGVSSSPKWHEDVSAFDNARAPSAFWWQGRLVEASGNIAASVPGGHGFIWMTRGAVLGLEPEWLTLPEQLGYRYTRWNAAMPSIASFHDNEAFGTKFGAEVIKAGAQQGHDNRTVLEDFTAWEVRFGFRLQYTAHYTLKNMVLIASDGKFKPNMSDSHGVLFDTLTSEITLNNFDIKGFGTGVDMRKSLATGEAPDKDWGYAFIGVDIDGAETEYNNLDKFDRILKSVDPKLQFKTELKPIETPGAGNIPIDLTGIKVDSLGEAVVNPESDRFRLFRLNIKDAAPFEGIWKDGDGRLITFVDILFGDRGTGDVDKVSQPFYAPFSADQYTPPAPDYGSIDLSAPAPVGVDDIITTSSWTKTMIPVLSNDKAVRPILDSHGSAKHGAVYKIGSEIMYRADYGYTGKDGFSYWVRSGESGKLDKVNVSINVK